jgi:hypothetical protein
VALSPFERDIGDEQGRIAEASAPAGSYVFELGHAGLESGSFETGDYIEVQQTSIDFDGQAALVRVTVNIELPETLPSGLGWEFTARLNGSARYTRALNAEPRTLSLTDIAIPTVAAGGSDTLSFRLEVVAV